MGSNSGEKLLPIIGLAGGRYDCSGEVLGFEVKLYPDNTFRMAMVLHLPQKQLSSR